MSYIQDPMSTPERWYYVYTAYYILEDDANYEDLDGVVEEVGESLEKSPTHAGAARDFELELDSYDEESKMAEIIVSFVVRLWEDDENELQLILSSVSEELEDVGFQVEETEFAGTGRRGNFN